MGDSGKYLKCVNIHFPFQPMQIAFLNCFEKIYCHEKNKACILIKNFEANGNDEFLGLAFVYIGSSSFSAALKLLQSAGRACGCSLVLLRRRRVN
jgi:hypothetical protein